MVGRTDRAGPSRLCSLNIKGALLAILSSVFIVACSGTVTDAGSDAAELPSTGIQRVGGPAMGTSWSAQWVTADNDDAHDSVVVQAALEAELARINSLMSTWDPNSDLSLFNASQSIEPTVLHGELLEVIDTALSVSRLTGGRYDITLKPVIELWGFSNDTVTPTPADEAIQAALEVSGYRQLVRVGDTIRKRTPQLAIDVSSLAKGYAVDQLAVVLEASGITRYLVEIGGELRARGTRADGRVWQVGIENPAGNIAGGVFLQDAAIASSGSYRNYRLENGKRLSHIIDGSTGRPIDHKLVSVSVVHDSAMEADAWATALMVVGEEAAAQLLGEQGLAAQLTTYRNGRFEQTATAEFSAMQIKD